MNAAPDRPACSEQVEGHTTFIRFCAWMGSSRQYARFREQPVWCKAVRSSAELAPERFRKRNGCPRYRALERVIAMANCEWYRERFFQKPSVSKSGDGRLLFSVAAARLRLDHNAAAHPINEFENHIFKFSNSGYMVFRRVINDRPYSRQCRQTVAAADPFDDSENHISQFSESAFRATL